MAKVKGGLFSLRAGGTVGKVLTFAEYRGLLRVKMYKKPKMPPDPHTELQELFRDRWRTAVLLWQTYTLEQKNIYNEKAKFLSLSGFNFFMKGYIGSHIILPSDAMFLPFWLDLDNGPF